MKIENKAWRQYEALNHVLNHFSRQDVDHDYLSTSQINEILNEILTDLEEKNRQSEIISRMKSRSRL